MFFCPKCNFSLDITKNIPNEISNNIEVATPKDLIDLILDNEIDGSLKITFQKKELLSSKEFKKLETQKQNEIQNKYDEITNIGFNKAYFICNHCQFITNLEPGIKLYEVSNTSKYTKNDIVSNKIKDNTLPRTKDFICPNSKCESKSNEKNKEAVFYRVNKESYNLKYVCTSCETSWLTGGNIIASN